MKIAFVGLDFGWSEGLAAPAASPCELPAAASNPATIDRLYRDHAQHVFGWALRLGASRSDAQDIVQEVFLRAQTGLPRVRTENVSAWLFGITRKVLDHQRRKERRRSRLDDQRAEPAAGLNGADAQLERFQTHSRVTKVLARLREPERVALVLFELEELSGEQAAELMGLKRAAFWQLLSRARTHFKARLDDEAQEV